MMHNDLHSTFFILWGQQRYGKRIKQLAVSTLLPPAHTYSRPPEAREMQEYKDNCYHDFL